MVQVPLSCELQKPSCAQETESIGSPKSMAATLEFDPNEQSSDGEEIELERAKVWGKLFPVGKHFEKIGVIGKLCSYITSI